MTKKLGKQTVELKSRPVIAGAYSSVGKKEGEGPLGKYFDTVYKDEFLHKKTWEQAESELLRQTVFGAAANAAVPFIDIDYILDERARELLGEENRWITLNRLSVNPNATYISDCHPIQDETTGNTMYDRARKYAFGYENLSGSNQPREWDPVEKRYISNFHPYNYQYPIPTQVIQSNTGIEYPQNTGY